MLKPNSHRRQVMEESEFRRKVPIKILISGTCRSGQRYMATVLQQCNLKVVHEGLGLEGAVSCYYAVDDYWYQGHHGARLSQLEPEHRWHHTRHPLGVMGSMVDRMPGGFWHWQEKHTGISGGMSPALLRAGLFWLKWNQIIEGQGYDFQYRVEDVPGLWPKLSGLLGITQEMPDVPHLQSGTDQNREPTTWQMLEDVDPILTRDVRQMAKGYGYED